MLENVSVSILRGEKVGLVGRNGSGKSSLLALLRGELSADSGECEVPAQLAIASVAQELPHSRRAVVEHVIDGDEALRTLETRLAAAEHAGDGIRQAALLAEFDASGGYTARSRAASLPQRALRAASLFTIAAKRASGAAIMPVCTAHV